LFETKSPVQDRAFHFGGRESSGGYQLASFALLNPNRLGAEVSTRTFEPETSLGDFSGFSK
jgi:hypothetical protein